MSWWRETRRAEKNQLTAWAQQHLSIKTLRGILNGGNYIILKLQVRFWFVSQDNYNTATTLLLPKSETEIWAPRRFLPQHRCTGTLDESLISTFYEGTQRQALEYLPSKSAAYYINYSVSKWDTGMKEPFSTLLILSFTPATSTLVLRGTLVLVRRILKSGTLWVRQRSHRQSSINKNHSGITAACLNQS